MLNQFKIIFAVAITVISWGSAIVAIRVGVQDYSPGSLALFRYLFASAIMGIFCLKITKFHKPSLAEGIKIFLIGLSGFAIYNIALNFGTISINAGVGSFILSLIPVFVAVLASIFLHERLNWLGWAGIIISALGVMIITLSESKQVEFNVGMIALLIAALSGGIYSVGQKSLLKKFHPLELTAYAIWSGTVGLLIFLPQLISEIPHASATTTFSAIYLGIVPGALGYASWNYTLSRIPAAKASSFLYLLPLVSIILEWIWLGDTPTLWSVFGGLIVLGGAIIVNSRNTYINANKKSINTNLQNV